MSRECLAGHHGRRKDLLGHAETLRTRIELRKTKSFPATSLRARHTDRHLPGTERCDGRGARAGCYEAAASLPAGQITVGVAISRFLPRRPQNTLGKASPVGIS